jgi:hypothetical protein
MSPVCCIGSIQTTRFLAADDLNTAARNSNALTSSERLRAAPIETRIAWGWLSSTLNVFTVAMASPCI